MASEHLLTLKETARRINRCERTFKKYVIDYQIPHILLGRDMLFDWNEVKDHLRKLTIKEREVEELQKVTPTRSKLKIAVSKKDGARNRYAKLLGLD